MALAASTVAASARDIVDTAVRAGQFKTLVAAVQAAGLVETLRGRGPFTVFAPTDAAFRKLPPRTLRSLLRPENRSQLRSILTYHVVPRRITAAQLTGSGRKVFGVRSVQGSNIRVDLRHGVRVSGANVVRTDIRASNGIIHVIDTVMIPPRRTH
jgi:uncharacterized surface protein with fasciclin (FAS1) repeats